MRTHGWTRSTGVWTKFAEVTSTLLSFEVGINHGLCLPPRKEFWFFQKVVVPHLVSFSNCFLFLSLVVDFLMPQVMSLFAKEIQTEVTLVQIDSIVVIDMFSCLIQLGGSPVLLANQAMVKAINNGSVQILLHQLLSLFLTEKPTSGQFVKFCLQLDVLQGPCNWRC